VSTYPGDVAFHDTNSFACLVFTQCGSGAYVCLRSSRTPTNCAVLCRNIEINAFEDHVAAYCIALSGVLNSPSREMGASVHQFGQKGQSSRCGNGRNTTSAQGVVGFSIDDFIGQFRPPFPTRLKIDVDGLEWPILQGARKIRFAIGGSNP
jgi:FkbM family methyltransferase